MALSTHLSNHKLYLLGMLCAILAWGMACIELERTPTSGSPASASRATCRPGAMKCRAWPATASSCPGAAGRC
ncbi:hypothetical protein P4M26_15105 [Pseudomonas aeruginosa]|nr:hypothetical protein [Pseudomonas aeruginosa]